MARSRAGFLLASSPAVRSLARYSCAFTNCSRTSDADLARVPGNGPPGVRIELVPLAIFNPPAMRPSGSVITNSSMVPPWRNFR